MNALVTTSPSMKSSSPPKIPEGPRKCSRCKAVIPVTDSHKMCASCREKLRLRSARLTQQKRASLLAQGNGNMSPELKRKLEDRADATVQHEKKRPKTASHDSSSGEVKSEIKSKSKKLKKQNHQVEYQTSAEMYSKLNACSKTKKYLFNGRFSIIADPKIDNDRRVSIVAKDLRKIANIPFEGTSTTSFVNKNLFGATFRCSCLEGTHKQHVATLYSRNPNATASSPLGSAIHTQTNDNPRCKGTIRVISEGDSSHPLGIAGQKIMITVEH